VSRDPGVQHRAGRGASGVHEAGRAAAPGDADIGAAGTPLLELVGLRTTFDTLAGPVRSVDGVSWRLDRGETLGIVGESGCGKSVTALSIMRLVPTPPARHEGAVRYRGTDLLALPERAMRRIRGDRISMIFQEPMTSLNPVLTIGRQIAETVVLHQKLDRRAARARAIEMLRLVQIAEPERRVDEYPHQLSGGMRQRVMIALALACNPEVLIADEPTTALDVTIQAQILELLGDLQRRLGMAVVLITHDLGVVAESCDRVVVMYAGRKVEEASVLDLFDAPLHPYTRALMASMPSLNASSARLAEIPGMVPAPQDLVTGCAFAARCAHATERCRREAPPLATHRPAHVAACFHVEQVAGSPLPSDRRADDAGATSRPDARGRKAISPEGAVR
jgi:peptide/nickel transport system ATP-binding protein